MKFVNGVLDAVRKNLGREVAGSSTPSKRYVRSRPAEQIRATPRAKRSRPAASHARRVRRSLATRTISTRSAARYRSDPRFDRRHHRRSSTARRKTRERSRPTAATTTAGRILAIRSFGKANFLVLSDGRAQDPGLHPAGLAARARLQDLQAARLRRLRRRRRAPVPHQDQRADDLGLALRVPGQVPPAAAREVARADATSRSATASAIWISSSTPTRGRCSKCAAACSRRSASS